MKTSIARVVLFSSLPTIVFILTRSEPPFVIMMFMGIWCGVLAAYAWKDD